MNPEILQFLTDMAKEILAIVGIFYLPLVVLIIYRAGHLRRLDAENTSEKLMDLVFDTIKEQIKDKVKELLQTHCNAFHLPFPSGQRINNAIASLHQDSESLEQLLTILKNLTELGAQSAEFGQILLSLF